MPVYRDVYVGGHYVNTVPLPDEGKFILEWSDDLDEAGFFIGTWEEVQDFIIREIEYLGWYDYVELLNSRDEVMFFCLGYNYAV